MTTILDQQHPTFLECLAAGVDAYHELRKAARPCGQDEARSTTIRKACDAMRCGDIATCNDYLSELTKSYSPDQGANLAERIVAKLTKTRARIDRLGRLVEPDRTE